MIRNCLFNGFVIRSIDFVCTYLRQVTNFRLYRNEDKKLVEQIKPKKKAKATNKITNIISNKHSNKRILKVYY